MRFSLIVATLGRTVELQRLLESLERQSHRDFEVIIVDQNNDDRLSPMVAEFEDRLAIRRLTSSVGVSRARNAGLRAAAGDVVCLPDDDCWYESDTLQTVNDLLSANPAWDGVVGDAVNPSGDRILPWHDRSGRLTTPMCWRRAVAFAYFFRQNVLQRVDGFNEMMGLGSGTTWTSGADTDFMLRIIEAGCYVQYDSNLRIHHPQIFPCFDENSRAKKYKYALADGLQLRKHPMPLWWVAAFYAVPAGRAAWSLLRMKTREARFHWATLAGRISGFRLSKVIVAPAPKQSPDGVHPQR